MCIRDRRERERERDRQTDRQNADKINKTNHPKENSEHDYTTQVKSKKKEKTQNRTMFLGVGSVFFYS